METALRRLDGVDKISISVPEQKFQVTFKPGAVFRPAEIRTAVGKAGVKVVGFHIDAKGRMADEEGKRVFLAGKQKFLVSGDAKIFEGPAAVEGAVDDAVEPMKLKILKFKSLK